MVIVTWHNKKKTTDTVSINSSCLPGDINIIIPLCCRPADDCFFVFESNQEMLCKLKSSSEVLRLRDWMNTSCQWGLQLTNNCLHLLRNVILLLFFCLHFSSHSGSTCRRLGHGQVCCKGTAASLVPEEHSGQGREKQGEQNKAP